jgi:ferric-dicitrate binding protein FerR (iron transport regulator)
MVVTAGSALIRNIEASVCIGVEGKRTVIAVLEGAVDISVLTTGEPRGEITLRTGDRVELRRVRADVMFHFASDELVGMPGCTDAIMRWAWADVRRQ